MGQEDPLEKGIATTPIFLPGKSQGQRSLVDYSPQGHKELDMTEVIEQACAHAHTHITHRIILHLAF